MMPIAVARYPKNRNKLPSSPFWQGHQSAHQLGPAAVGARSIAETHHRPAQKRHSRTPKPTWTATLKTEPQQRARAAVCTLHQALHRGSTQQGHGRTPCGMYSLVRHHICMQSCSTIMATLQPTSGRRWLAGLAERVGARPPVHSPSLYRLGCVVLSC